MSGKQNFIFFLGLSLILLNFYFHGGFKVITHSIFGPGGIANPNPPANQVPGGAGSTFSSTFHSLNSQPGSIHIPGTPISIPPGLF